MDADGRNLVLWLEDRQETIAQQVTFCKEQGLEIKVVGTLPALAEELSKKNARILLIVLDVMLYGVQSLDAIGIKNAPTDMGRNAGWIILDRFLRDPEHGKDYRDIPVLIISTRTLQDEEKILLESLKARGGSIRYIEKGGINEEGDVVWTAQFEMYIKDIIGKK